MDHTAILDKIKRVRKERGYSHEHMADRLHMSSSAYQRHEADHTKLDLDWLQAVAKVLEVDLLDLLRGSPMVVNLRDHSEGVCGHNNVLHQNSELAEALKTINQHHAEQLREQREFNAKVMAVLDRMMAFVERSTDSHAQA